VPRRREIPSPLRVALFAGALLACRSNPAIEAQENPATLSDYTLAGGPQSQWRLPGRLREISGLAASGDGRLFAHDDERGVIYEVDPLEGRLVKAFALGDVTAVDDFEGIAVVEDHFYLVSSDGRLYESPEGEDGERMLFNTYGTGVGRRCEVEGLAYEPADRTLLLLCKTARDPELGESVNIYRWSVDERAMASDSVIRISRAALTEGIPGNRFSPSGIERHPETGHYFIVAAREEAIAVVDQAGEVQSVKAFADGAHRQAEGITFTPQGSLLIADEGGGGRARLSLYERRPPDGREDRRNGDPPDPDIGPTDMTSSSTQTAEDGA
jgi:uncharacterized protein YjiK